MKKLFLIMCLGLIAIFANAQLATVTIPTDASAKVIATDYTLTNTTPAYIVVNAAQHYPTTQDFTVAFTKASGSQTRVNVVLYGQKASNTPWVQIATGYWKLTTADTVLTVSNATANRYRNYKILYTGTGTGTTTITNQDMKLFFEK